MRWKERLNVDPQLINFHTDIFMMDMPIANGALIDFHKQSINGSKKKLGSEIQNVVEALTLCIKKTNKR